MKKDYISNIEGAERRFNPQQVEFREEGEEKYFEGYSAKFGAIADLGWFTEEVMPGAFDEVLSDDVRGLFNHDPDVLLGRSSSGTMDISVDSVGAKYKIKYNPNDPDHVRVMEKVKRGDVSQSSFAFHVKTDTWEMRDGKDHRKIIKFSRWIDNSPVTFPAYEDTTVAARSKEVIEKPKNEFSEMEMRHAILKIKNKIKIG